jgi:ribosomal protein S18 acetylase RimI-like enzyme
MYISRVNSISDEYVAAFEHLIPQLTANHPPPTRAELSALVDSNSSAVFVARLPDERGPIVGALTLVTYRVPTGIRARIEDVIVEEKMRRLGIAKAMIHKALETARQAGADGVSLTSNPRRVTANRLYQRMGFVRWETNTYFFKFDH